MSLYQSKWATRQRNTVAPDCAGDEAAWTFEFPLTATALQVGDIIELGVLPAGNAPADAILLSDQLDTNGTPTLAFDVGIMTGDVGALLNADGSARTMGNELFAADTGARTGAVSRMSKQAGFTLAPSAVDRSIGVKITAAAATQAAAGAVLRLMLMYRPV